MMGSTVEFRKAFVGRLKQSCDESKHIPLPGHGRQQFIVDRLKVTPEAVSKWFNGVSMPRPDKMEALGYVQNIVSALRECLKTEGGACLSPHHSLK